MSVGGEVVDIWKWEPYHISIVVKDEGSCIGLRVVVSDDSLCIERGDTIWWQDRYVMWSSKDGSVKDKKIARIGYSFPVDGCLTAERAAWNRREPATEPAPDEFPTFQQVSDAELTDDEIDTILTQKPLLTYLATHKAELEWSAEKASHMDDDKNLRRYRAEIADLDRFIESVKSLVRAVMLRPLPPPAGDGEREALRDELEHERQRARHATAALAGAAHRVRVLQKGMEEILRRVGRNPNYSAIRELASRTLNAMDDPADLQKLIDAAHRVERQQKRAELGERLIAWAADEDNAYACDSYTVQFCLFCKSLDGTHPDWCLHERARALRDGSGEREEG